MGELGLAPPRNIDFSSEIDRTCHYRPELATRISQYPVLVINDPTDPDGNAVKKLCDTTQQYEAKYKNQSSIYQRASVVLTMNHPPEFRTSAMENKVFFICSQQSFAGEEIPDDEYLAIIRADGSLRDLWQAIIHQGITDNWKITIPQECIEHNRIMQIGAAPLQKWLSACKPAPKSIDNFHTLQEIYENYMIAINPDAGPQEVISVLKKHMRSPAWTPSPKKDGIEGKSKIDVKKSIQAIGIPNSRIKNQQGFYIYLPMATGGIFMPNSQYQDPQLIDTEQAWKKMRGKTTQKIIT